MAGSAHTKKMDTQQQLYGLTFDELSRKYLGYFGWYQGFVLISVSLIALPLSFSSLDISFVMATPSYWCLVPELRNQQQEYTNGNASFLAKLKTMSPRGKAEESSFLGYSSCRVYDIDYADQYWWTELQGLVQEERANNNSSGGELPERACTDWRFDKSQYESTVTTQWQLVCDKEWLVVVSYLVLLLGHAVGAVLCGFLADIIGRRMVCVSCLVLHVFLRLASAFSNSYGIYVFLRLIMASTAAGVLVSMKVLLLELVGGRWRAVAGLSDSYMYSLGYLFMACLAYGIRHWQTLTLALTVPFAPLLLTLIITPESARFFFIKGFNKAGDQALKDIAKVNNKTLPTNVFMQIKDNSLTKRETSVSGLCHNRDTIRKTCIICVIWFVSSGVYLGLSHPTLEFTASIYSNTALTGVLELLCLVTCTWLVNTWFGRRMTLSLSLLLCGNFLLILLAVVPDECESLNAGSLTVVTLAKCSVTVSLATLALVTMETTPTAFRCLVLGTGMTCGQLGGMLALLLAQMGCSPRVPGIIVSGLACLLMCGLSLFLPETRTTDLPDCLSDADNMSVRQKKTPTAEPREFRESLPLKIAVKS